MEYKVGDRVLLKTLEQMPSREELKGKREWDWVWPHMNQWCGQLVTITSFVSSQKLNDHYNIAEDGNEYYYPVLAIVDTDVENARILVEREEKRIEAERAWNNMVWRGEDVLRIAEEVFGPERVELNIATTDSKSYNIVIHFPEIRIKDAKENNRLLKDMFVRIIVGIAEPGEIYKGSVNIQGIRTTLFLKEIVNGYSHSHLHLNNYGSYQFFCLGGDSDIAILLQNLRMSMKEEDWFLLFYSIQPYLEWESREGGPYFYMENLRLGRSVNTDQMRKEIGRIIKYSPSEVWSFTDRLQLVDNHPSFSEFLNERSSIRSSSTLAEKDVEEYLKIHEQKLPKGKFTFKGKEIPYKLENDVEPSSTDIPVSKDIKDSYIYIIKTALDSFSKTFNYEKYKSAQVREARII